jgi:mRNA interferase RelE/StbE
MKWNLVVTGSAQKELRNLPRRDRERVRAALLDMCDDPFRGDLRRLQAQTAAWRRRVGNYRILFDVDPNERLILVHAIVRRTSTTY